MANKKNPNLESLNDSNSDKEDKTTPKMTNKPNTSLILEKTEGKKIINSKSIIPPSKIVE